jgi:ABC-type glutathione transport system ATPase component
VPRNPFVVRDLAVGFRTASGVVPVVSGVSLKTVPGRIVGVAGESGSGKTTAVLTAIGYEPAAVVRLGGDANLGNVPILLRAIARNEDIAQDQDLSTLENPAIVEQLRGNESAVVAAAATQPPAKSRAVASKAPRKSPGKSAKKRPAKKAKAKAKAEAKAKAKNVRKPAAKRRAAAAKKPSRKKRPSKKKSARARRGK